MAKRPSRSQRLVQRADHRCEYCGYPEEVSPVPLEIDHIIPQAKGGRTILTNLALACRHCNQHKGTKTIGLDPETQQTVRLFNPRTNRWVEHFQFLQASGEMIGLSPIGRATVHELHMNDRRSVRVRLLLIKAGLVSWPR
jgi:hypothetical protein